MGILRMGSRGEAVRRLQQRLNEVGDYGLVVDGRFGANTRRAVVDFQRSKGLADDGLAGPITLGALGLSDAPEPGGPSPEPPAGRKRSLHVGVNLVDPAHYDGWDGRLSGCENDAQTMRTIALSDGFTSTSLLTRQATASNVLAEILDAARELERGDVFLLTYAGHGAQVPNVGGDDEIDNQDETWVLYERMLIDDELEAAFSAFSAGVDIILLSDSCHSGTVYRSMFDPQQLAFAQQKSAFYRGLTAPAGATGSRAFPVPALVDGSRGPGADASTAQRELFAAAASTFSEKLRSGASRSGESGYVSFFERFERLRGPRSRSAALGFRRTPRRESRSVESDERELTIPVATRNMPIGVNAAVVARHATFYADVQAGARGHATVQANGLSISGCQDAQLSQEVGGNGVFTTTLKEVWNSHSFSGSFTQFHRAIAARMGPTQTPELGLWGGDPQALAAKTPFA